MIELTYWAFGSGNVVPPTTRATDRLSGTISERDVRGSRASACAKSRWSGDLQFADGVA